MKIGAARLAGSSVVSGTSLVLGVETMGSFSFSCYIAHAIRTRVTLTED